MKPKTDLAIALSKEKTVKSVILKNYGGTIKIIRYLSNILTLARVCWIFFNVRNKIIIIQYPFLIGCIKQIMIYLHKNNNRIAVLCHDVESLRLGVKSNNERILMHSDIIIAHSPEMAKELKKQGFNGKFEILEFFDYCSNICKPVNVSKSEKNIVFAGNLQKSKFLYHLSDSIIDSSINYFLYGKNNVNLPTNNHIIYKGVFDAEDFSSVQGNWGLVWDGESIEKCSGPYGKYLQINAPFKFSLYLAMNIPVIVWSESAMAQYVKKYHLGICVNSLKDISSTIDNLSENDLKDIANGVSKASIDVKAGKKIRHVVNSLQEL